MTDIERFKIMLDQWDPVFETEEFAPELQLARRIIDRYGLGTPAESIRLPKKEQIQMAWQILFDNNRMWETSITVCGKLV